MLMEELLKKIHLLAKLKISLKNLLYAGHIHAIYLRSIYLTIAIIYHWMEAHSSNLLRNLARNSKALTVVQEALVTKLNLVHIADADNTLALVHARNSKLKSYWLHKAILATLLGLSTCKVAYKAVTRCVNGNCALNNKLTLARSNYKANNSVALLNNIGNGSLQIDIDIWMVYKLRQEHFCTLKVVSSASLANHIVLRNAKQLNNLVAHSSLADHTENWAYIARSKVTTHNTIALNKRHLCSLTSRSNSCTNTRRA